VARISAISNRIPEDFPTADAFRPDRYESPSRPDTVTDGPGSPSERPAPLLRVQLSAQMQIRRAAGFLLREYECEMGQPAASTKRPAPRWLCSSPPAKAHDAGNNWS